MGVITERLAVIIDAQAGGAIKEFDKLSQAAERSGASTGGLAGVFEKVGLSAGAAGTAATAAVAGATFLGASLLAVAKSGIDQYLGLADAVRATQRVIGGTTQEASGLVAEFTALGVAQDVAQTGLFRFSKNLGETPQKLEALGVQLQRNSDGTVNVAKTLGNLGQTYRNTADATQRAALVQTAFGRGGQALVPILTATQERLEGIYRLAQSRGEILSADDVEKARQFQFGMRQLGEEFKAFEITIGGDIVRNVNDFVQNFVVGIGTIRNVLNGQGYHEAQLNAARDYQAARNVARLQGEAAAEQEAADAALASGQKLIDSEVALGQASDRVAQARRTAADAEKTLADARKAQAEFAASEARLEEQDSLSVAQALQAQVDASRRLQDAEANLSSLRAQQAAGTLLVRDAEEALARARFASLDANKQLEDAERHLDELRNPSAKTKEGADLRVAQAQQALARAQQAEADAANRLNHAHGKDRAQAEQDLADAHLAVRSATDALSDAQDEQNRVLGIGADAARDLANAQEDVDKAKLNVKTTTEDQSKAEDDYASASQRAADIIKKAEQDVADAKLGVRGATDQVNDAEKKLADDRATRADRQKAVDQKVIDSAGAVKRAQDGIVDALVGQQKAQDAFNKAASDPKAVDAAISNLGRLGSKYREVAGLLTNLVDLQGLSQSDLNKRQDLLSGRLQGPVGGNELDRLGLRYDVPSKSIVARASGGPLEAGQAALVGEAGMELFVPRTAGTIVPNGALGGGDVVVHAHLHLDGREIAESTTRHQRRARRNGGDPFVRR
jgi:hypothetical protein